MCQRVIDPVALSGSQGWTWITSPGGHDSENPSLVLALRQLAASDSDTEDARGSLGVRQFRGTREPSAECVVSLPLRPPRGREQQDHTWAWRLAEKR